MDMDAAGSDGFARRDGIEKLIAKMCDQCEQEFGSDDRFAPQGVKVPLRCSKYKFNPKTGKRDLPHGCECHCCQVPS